MPRLLCALMLLAAVVLVPAGSNMAQVAVAPDDLAARAQGKQNGAASRRLGIGREAMPEEIAGWDTDIRPDGEGLPTGKGTVKDGEALFTQRCAGCHGEFGEGVGRWPALSGGAGTLTGDRPVKGFTTSVRRRMLIIGSLRYKGMMPVLECHGSAGMECGLPGLTSPRQCACS